MKLAQETLTIGELRKRAGGVTLRTIRYYEERRLLQPCATTAGGQKRYGLNALLVLKQVQLLQRAGLSLEEITHLLQRLSRRPTANRARQKAHAEILVLIREKLSQRIAALNGLLGTLDQTLRHAATCDGCKAADCGQCGVLDAWLHWGLDLGTRASRPPEPSP